MRVIIWGAGKYLPYVYEGIIEEADIVAIVDSNSTKHGEILYGIEVIPPQMVCEFEYDVIVLSPLNPNGIRKYLQENGYGNQRIISFWESDGDYDVFKSRRELLLHSTKQREIYEARLESAPYEWGLREVPTIKSSEELLDKILKTGCSLSRYGDGEFNIMMNKGFPWFQEYNEELAQRLREVINSKNENLIIAIAQNFRFFDRYTVEAADEIRIYMQKKWQDITNLLPKREYYDAYVSRPYLIFRNKENARRVFSLLKKIWCGRKLLIVEGQHGRMGVGNDLFQGALSIKRIVCPDKNVWDVYNLLLEKIIAYVKTERSLVCISLGPVATVLAHDLCVNGIQALDIGQIDNEYEWWMRNSLMRTQIEGKMVAELPQTNISDDFVDALYYEQIVDDVT